MVVTQFEYQTQKWLRLALILVLIIRVWLPLSSKAMNPRTAAFGTVESLENSLALATEGVVVLYGASQNHLLVVEPRLPLIEQVRLCLSQDVRTTGYVARAYETVSPCNR